VLILVGTVSLLAAPQPPHGGGPLDGVLRGGAEQPVHRVRRRVAGGGLGRVHVRERHVDRHHAAADLDPARRRDVLDQGAHPGVRAEQLAAEVRDAALRGGGAQPEEQQLAEPAAVQLVDDRDRGLGGGRRVGQPDEARHAETDGLAVAVAALGDRAEREVMLLIDLGEVAQLVQGQRLLRAEEPRVARRRRQPLEPGEQELLVRGRDEPQPHHGAVAEARALDVVGGEVARGPGHPDIMRARRGFSD
jgi:hypothetical protein